MNPSRNIIEISSLKEAHQAILIVKKRVKFREQDLELRLKRIPEETFKASARLILPPFINNLIGGRSWNILKDIIGLLSAKNADKISLWKDIAKQVGVMGILKSVGGIFKRQTQQ